MIILGYIFYFIAASASPIQRRFLAKKKDFGYRDQVSFSFHVFLFLVIGSLAFPFFSRFYLSGDSFYLFLLSLVCGVFGAACFVTNYIAQKHLDAGVSNLLNNINIPIIIILSSFFLNEGLKLSQIAGVVVLLFAVMMVSKKHRIGRFKFDKYFLLMAASGIMLGILLVAERALQKTTGFSAGTMLSWWSQCVFLGMATLYMKSKHSYTKKELFVTGSLRFLQALSYVILVFIVGNLSLVSVVTTFKVVIVFIAAAIFLHEREDVGRKIFGSIIAVIGLLLMK